VEYKIRRESEKEELPMEVALARAVELVNKEK
jgi:hypothetical protein